MARFHAQRRTHRQAQTDGCSPRLCVLVLIAASAGRPPLAPRAGSTGPCSPPPSCGCAGPGCWQPPFIALSTYYGRALRWAVMIRGSNRQPNLWGLFSATAVGFTAIILFGRAGRTGAALPDFRQGEGLLFLSTGGLGDREDLRSAGRPPHLRLGPGLGGTLRSQGRSRAAMDPAGGRLPGRLHRRFLRSPLRAALRQSSGDAAQRMLDALAFCPTAGKPRSRDFLSSFSSGVECTRSLSGVLSLARLHAPGMGSDHLVLSGFLSSLSGPRRSRVDGRPDPARLCRLRQPGSDPRRSAAASKWLRFSY